MTVAPDVAVPERCNKACDVCAAVGNTVKRTGFVDGAIASTVTVLEVVLPVESDATTVMRFVPDTRVIFPLQLVPLIEAVDPFIVTDLPVVVPDIVIVETLVA